MRSKILSLVGLVIVLLGIGTGPLVAQPAPAEHAVLLAGDPNRIHRVGKLGATVANTRLVSALGGTSAIADAFSFGRDFGHHRIGHAFFLFSTVPSAGGKRSVKGSPHFLEYPGETAADIFWVPDILHTTTELVLAHGKASDENDASNVPVYFPPSELFPIARSLGLGGVLGTPVGSDDIVGYDPWPPLSLGIEDDIYFSIDRVVTLPCPGAPLTVGPGDILRLPGTAPADPCSIELFQSAASLGLLPGDDIDGLAINRRGDAIVNGVFVTGAVDPTGWYSVTASSPSLVGTDRTGGDLFLFVIGASYPDLESQLHMTCEGLALCAGEPAEDVDSLGHIDPEDIHVFCHRPEQLLLPDGLLEGFLGAEVVPGAPIAFGSGFGPFRGSYSVALDGVPDPQGAVPGDVGTGVIGPIPPDPGGTRLLEIVGVRGGRFLIDRRFVRVPATPTAPPPITNLVATFDPSTGNVLVDWDPPGGTAGTLLFVNGTFEGAIPPPVVLPAPPPGAVVVEVRPFTGSPFTGTVGEGTSAVVFIDSPVPPPRAVTIVENPGNPHELSWIDPPQGTAILVVLDGQPVAPVPLGTGTLSILLNPGLHFVTLRTQDPQGVSVPVRAEIFVPLPAPPALPPRPHQEYPGNGLPFDAAAAVPTGPTVTVIPIVVPAGTGAVADVEAIVAIEHPSPEALRITLTSPNGTTLSLVEPLGVTGTRIDRHFDDLSLSTPDDQAGDVLPDDAIDGGAGLAVFDGEPSSGTWEIAIENHAFATGTIDAASLLIATGATSDFRRGDANDDGNFDIGDPIAMLGVLFPSGGPPAPLACADAGDTNDDGSFDIADAIFALGVLFPLGGGTPTLPPPGLICGADPTPDGLDCASSGACP